MSSIILRGTMGSMIPVNYHSTIDHEQKAGFSVDSGISINHNHPSAAKTVEIFIRLLQENQYAKAAEVIDAISVCALHCGTCHYSDYLPLADKIFEQDMQLHKVLLNIYQQAIRSSKAIVAK